jgi:hypothetical protein
MRRSRFLLVLAFLLASALGFAQYGGPRYTIVRADYGSGNTFRDVTSLVSSMIHNNQLNFQVTNDGLGGDPAPGQVKTLRLQVRGERGDVQTMTFRENDIVSLVIANGGGSGWQGGGDRGLRITQAQYGSGNRMRDVTGLLNSQIQNGHIGMRVGNDTLGGDPAPGSTKSLIVSYVSGGRPGQITLAEGDYLTLGGGRDDDDDRGHGRGLRILRAEYGAGDRLVDVTARLNSQIRDGQLSLTVTNDTMGRDPVEEHRKALTVWYEYRGRTATITVPEKSVLTLPNGNPSYVGNLVIMRAQYGADYRFRDVTGLLSSRVQSDQLNMRINNDAMGGDPAPDRPKILTVSYEFNGQPGQVVISENGTLNLPGSGGDNGWNWPGGGGRLQIMRASFGAGDRNTDVTSRLASQVQGDTLNMAVNRDTMGGDPAPGQTKRLKIIYLWQGLRYETNVPEGGTVSLP